MCLWLIHSLSALEIKIKYGLLLEWLNEKAESYYRQWHFSVLISSLHIVSWPPGTVHQCCEDIFLLNYKHYAVCCCSVARSCLILCDPTNRSMPGFPVLHHLLEFVQTQVHWVADAIQPSHPLSPPATNHSEWDLMELPSTKVTLTWSKDQRSTYQVPSWHTVGALQMVLLFSQGPLLTECRKHTPPAISTSPLNPMSLPPGSQNNCLATVLHSNGRIQEKMPLGFLILFN